MKILPKNYRSISLINTDIKNHEQNIRKLNATMWDTHTKTKWDLFQVCKAGSTFKNQLLM